MTVLLHPRHLGRFTNKVVRRQIVVSISILFLLLFIQNLHAQNYKPYLDALNSHMKTLCSSFGGFILIKDSLTIDKYPRNTTCNMIDVGDIVVSPNSGCKLYCKNNEEKMYSYYRGIKMYNYSYSFNDVCNEINELHDYDKLIKLFNNFKNAYFGKPIIEEPTAIEIAKTPLELAVDTLIKFHKGKAYGSTYNQNITFDKQNNYIKFKYTGQTAEAIFLNTIKNVMLYITKEQSLVEIYYKDETKNTDIWGQFNTENAKTFFVLFNNVLDAYKTQYEKKYKPDFTTAQKLEMFTSPTFKSVIEPDAVFKLTKVSKKYGNDIYAKKLIGQEVKSTSTLYINDDFKTYHGLLVNDKIGYYKLTRVELEYISGQSVDDYVKQQVDKQMKEEELKKDKKDWDEMQALAKSEEEKLIKEHQLNGYTFIDKKTVKVKQPINKNSDYGNYYEIKNDEEYLFLVHGDKLTNLILTYKEEPLKPTKKDVPNNYALVLIEDKSERGRYIDFKLFTGTYFTSQGASPSKIYVNAESILGNRYAIVYRFKKQK